MLVLGVFEHLLFLNFTCLQHPCCYFSCSLNTLLTKLFFIVYMCLCRSFIEDSQAHIKISPQDHNFVGLNDRLVTLTGSLEELLRAVDLILTKLTEDAYYLRSIYSPWPYVGMLYFHF